MNRAVFLDRDGTINIDFGYVHNPDRFVFIDGVFEFCLEAVNNGFLIIVITNQSGIERGYFSEAEYEYTTKYMVQEFARRGIQIADVFCCPSLSGFDRKPSPGLFIKAQNKYDIDMSHSINIGDKDRDIQAGKVAGVGVNILFTGEFPKISEIVFPSKS